MEGTLQEIMAIVEKSPNVYLSTINLETYPETRPLCNLRHVVSREQYQQFFHGNSLCYFTTSITSPKITQMRRYPQVSCYFEVPETQAGVILFGQGQLVDDQKMKQDLWLDTFLMYYPSGVQDPQYGIIQFTPLQYKFYKFIQDGQEPSYQKFEGSLTDLH